MNMKKTIAAVAASAVAVSAMATSVSAIDVLEHGTSDLAFQAQTVHYNLVKEVKEYNPTVVFTATYEEVDVSAGNVLTFALDNAVSGGVNLIAGVKDVKITGTYIDNQGANVGAVAPIYFTTDAGSEKYNDALKTAGATGKLVLTCGPATIQASGAATKARLTVSYTLNLNAAFKGANGATLDGGWGEMEAINKALVLNGGAAQITLDNSGAAVAGITTASSFDKGESVNKYPFRTGLNDYFNDVTPDIVAYVKGLGYKNATAVINDLIANYDEVTFKFNTAVQAVDDSTKKNTGKYCEDWEGNKIYKSFAQHLYNLYGEEFDKNLQNTGYINYDWTGYNLFAGALIVNDEYSMSLNDASVFDYGETSLSFNWADLNNGAAYNPVVNYVRTIKLATSREWYWDSLDITGAIVESENAATNEGTEAEEETIGEEEEELGEEEEAEEPEVEEEEPAAEEEEPAAPAENPATGNAPIALAVIPVALAAAAVVAKKRG